MKLWLDRQQEIKTNRRGQSEGALFHLSCRLDLSQHERELIDTYAQENYPVAMLQMDDVRDFRPSRPEEHIIRLPQLIEGWSISTKFVSGAHRAEEVVREGCESFQNVLLAMESYGGQEEVDF
jgi:hypothetical protein